VVGWNGILGYCSFVNTEKAMVKTDLFLKNNLKNSKYD